MSLFIESLEDRSLMSSVHPAVVLHPAATNPVLVADQKRIVELSGTLRLDTITYNNVLRDDQVAARLARSVAQAKLTQARHAFAADRGNPTNRIIDLGNIQIAQANLRTATVAANQKIKSDNGVKRGVLANDRRLLLAARLQLRLDRLQQRIAK